MKLLNVPIIDIAPFRLGSAHDKAAVARQVDQACRDIGFLVIRGHGVDPNLIEATQAVSRAFFALPLADKLKVARPSRQVPQWWRLSWQPTERTAQVRKIDNTFDPLTWSIFPGVFHGTGMVSGSVTCLDL